MVSQGSNQVQIGTSVQPKKIGEIANNAAKMVNFSDHTVLTLNYNRVQFRGLVLKEM